MCIRDRALVLAVLIYTTQSAAVQDFSVDSSLEFAVLLLKEFAVGYLLGFLLELLDMVFTFAGTLIDFQMGISMAQVYDPQNGAQIAPVSYTHLDVYKRQGQNKTGGVVVTEIAEDPSDFEMVYDPEHPDADANGYVAVSYTHLSISKLKEKRLSEYKKLESKLEEQDIEEFISRRESLAH